MYSKELFEKYPYAFSHDAWTGKVCCEDNTNEPYSLDEDIPKGWSKLFWMCMEEIREPLEKAGLINTFYFVQVKEKYGELCLYNNGATEEVLDILIGLVIKMIIHFIQKLEIKVKKISICMK